MENKNPTYSRENVAPPQPENLIRTVDIYEKYDFIFNIML